MNTWDKALTMGDAAEMVLYMAKRWQDSVGADIEDVQDLLDELARTYTSGTEEINPDKVGQWRAVFAIAEEMLVEGKSDNS